jgi:hypothetical protein
MTGWGVWVLAAMAALAPGRASAQAPMVENLAIGSGNPLGGNPTNIGYTGYAPPANGNTIFPLYSTRPEEGGIYVGGGFVLYQWTNPLKSQLVAVRGFTVTDDSVLGPGTSGQFVGSRTNALDVNQVTGPSTYNPGFNIDIGWKFNDGTALDVGYTYFFNTQLRAVATLAAPHLQFGSNFAETFLFSDVFNFPPEFAGPPFKINPPNTINQESVYGIWNGATVETIEFIQRVQQLEATYRIPVYETECYRVNGLVGPRFFWIWERFKWLTSSYGSGTQGVNPFLIPTWAAQYTNIVSNRMYGAHAGIQQEWYVGHGFATMLDAQVAAFIDIVKERAKYELALKDAPPQNKRAKTTYQLVPEFQLTPAIMWYPYEGIQVKVGYDLFAFLNTISSPRPIDFNYSALDPNWVSTARFFDGFQASISFSF